MIKISQIRVIENFRIYFRFSDNAEKIIDFKPYIGTDPLTSRLSNAEFFSKVRIYENGRGIYWPNEYDFCPDFLRYHTPSQHPETLAHN